MKQIDKTLLPLIVILFALNCAGLYVFSEFTFRIFRVIASGSLLLIYLTAIYNRTPLSTSVLLLMLASDCMLLNYENDYFKIAHYILRGLSYLMIAYQTKLDLEDKKLNIFSRLYLVTIMSFILYLLFVVGETFTYEDHNFLIISLFYFQGTAAIIMFLMAVLSLNNNSSKHAVFAFFPTLGFIISDVSAFVAYHLGFSYFYLFDRLFYLLAIASFIKYNYVFSTQEIENLQENNFKRTGQ